YNKLVHLINRRAPTQTPLPPNILLRFLLAFSQIISNLNSNNHTLVDAILSLDWAFQNDNFVLAYRKLLENLVSSDATIVKAVLGMLVRHLRYGMEFTSVSLPDRTHNMIRSILALVPTGASQLLPILQENFPYKSESLKVHELYMKNLLRIVDYAPVLRNQILAISIDKIIQIDVEIQADVDDLEDEELENVQRMVFAMDELDHHEAAELHPTTTAGRAGAGEPDVDDDDEDDDDEDGPNNYDDDDDDEDATAPTIVVNFKLMVQKLDSMLKLLFEYFLDFYRRNKSQPLVVQDLFHVMMEVFERTVLPTYKSRHTQFLWFYLCSLDAAFPELFLGHLLSRLMDTSSATIIRVSSAAYIGSFIARANFLEASTVQTMLKMLNGWAYTYVDKMEWQVKHADVSRYTVFYSVVQAIVYIFCFRWKELMSMDRNIPYGQLPAEMMGFQRVVMSKFNPLKICAFAVVGEFAKITHRLDVLYCYNLIERPAPKNLPPLAAPEALEVFFPFDPYMLKASRHFINGIYQEWVNEDDEDEDHGSESHSVANDEFINSLSSDHSDTLFNVPQFKGVSSGVLNIKNPASSMLSPTGGESFSVDMMTGTSYDMGTGSRVMSTSVDMTGTSYDMRGEPF
ncbi:RNA polymerase I-specific transcription initiation factor RRN3, partial [Polychytrium aggregatum]|uniref:RNA polymerase I-specific transcription initiation factor RRN3 n=1 Tax=Polychytrium aggregatum TaxID=110093 RepID=UPI0022FE659F